MIQTTEMVRVVTTEAPFTCRRQQLHGLAEVWTPGESHRLKQLQGLVGVKGPGEDAELQLGHQVWTTRCISYRT